MTKYTESDLFLTLDTSAKMPLYQQLYRELRQAILTGKLSANQRLPSTRLLAQKLDLSRLTVLTAFEQLYAEGYIYGKVGSGTYVAPDLPDELLHLPAQIEHALPDFDTHRSLSRRGQVIAGTRVSPRRYWDDKYSKPFRLGLPALEHFPFDIWARLMAQCGRNLSAHLLNYTHPAGYPGLRAEIAAYVQAARGVRCAAEQVIIVSGAQQGIDLAIRLLLDPDDQVWLEDPCYLGTRGALQATSAQIVPIPVDEEGLVVTEGIRRAPGAQMVSVTPSHQFPLGVTMSLSRRLALLQWANQSGAWILEDDYDSEYRYTGRPLSSLQGLDCNGRVIYVGTMSKVLFPGLRLGYLVVPPDLIDAFTAARAIADRQPPILDQLVLTEFMVQGHFSRHLRRMRTLYHERLQCLQEEVARELGGFITLRPAEVGMHVVGLLNDDLDAVHLSQLLAQHDIIAPAVKTYTTLLPAYNGLLFGYPSVNQQEMHATIQSMAQVLQSALSKKQMQSL
ncbi:MocR-like pyridoxine biosynthesis transcription factor PdxR [Tengunoibacter tsumagoiensis]|uniref:GntR family transcriptional regulator n=1 Tax=Tengunoibacter tsumagoiensis TaxID=2014871 RepID=A0A402A6A2_9CHLR|nr:PLP-dependent aminotransferase family protein [Tengunoibacter tsumagoiensis]GCE14677.1 GntR family transcriptional regulator [Tengunoibacter tsumagoiensis]